MPTPKTPNVRLHGLAHEALERLIDELDTEIGVTATRRDVVNALIYGATAAQTSGMLPVFKRAAAAADGAPEAGARAQEAES